MASFLKGNEAAETAAGVGGSSSRDESEDTWSAKFSCSLGEDTFTVTITREYMLINGFETDRVKENEEQKLIDRHKTQLSFYAEAIEKLTGRPDGFLPAWLPSFPVRYRHRTSHRHS